MAHTLQKWDRLYNKDNEEYYADPQFQLDYMNQRMLRKARDCEDLIQNEVSQLVNQLAAFNQYQFCQYYRVLTGASSISVPPLSIRVLSLGCGCGPDLLAAVGACRSTGRVSRVECYGVDKFNWPNYVLNEQLRQLSNKYFSVQAPGIYGGDFVPTINYWISLGVKFDLVIAHYVRARDHCDFLTQTAPRLLNRLGRIFVIDNNSGVLQRGLMRRYQTVCTKLNGKLIFLQYTHV